MPLQRDWRIINHVLNSARYEMAVASIPISQVGVSPVNLVALQKIPPLLSLQFYRHVMLTLSETGLDFDGGFPF